MSKKVKLAPLFHRNENHISIQFDYNEEIKRTVLKLGAKFTKTHRCFYIKNTSANKRKLYLQLRKIDCILDYSAMPKYKKEVSKPKVKPMPASHVEALQAFRDYLEGQRKSASTIHTYSNFIELFLKFHAQRNLSDLGLRDVEQFLEQVIAKRKYSISSHRQCISGLKHFSKLKLGLQYDPEDLYLPKKDKKLPVVLSSTEIVMLLRVTKNLKHRAIIGLLYSSGLRIGELLNLKLNDLDLERNMIYVKQGKGRKDRNCSLGQRIRPMLLNYAQTYQPKVYLFEGDEEGKPYNASSVRNFLKRSCAAAKISKHITPHTLRHTYATHLLENGVDVRYIQELLGHSRPETTMIYTHVTERKIDEITNPLDSAIDKYNRLDNHPSNPLLSRNNLK
jgi:site-specific recombinase XerD